MVAGAADLGHEYEDLEKYSVAPPAASRDEYEVINDAVELSVATGPVGEIIAGSDYDDIKHTEATAVPGGGTTADDAVEYSEVTGTGGGTTTSGDDFDITKCPAYVPVVRSLEEASVSQII